MERHREISRGAVETELARAAELARRAGFETEFVGDRKTEVLTQIGALEELGDGVFLAKLRESPFYPAGGGQVTDVGFIERDGDPGTRAGARCRVPLRERPGAGASRDRIRGGRPRTSGRAVERALPDDGEPHRHASPPPGAARRARRARAPGGFGGAARQAPLRLHARRGAHRGAARRGRAAREREDLRGLPVHVFETPIDEARRLGATMLFGEKYGDIVRVVEIPGYSIELCGGTHVATTAEIGAFAILSEGSVGSGVRRIEAVTSGDAWAYLKERSRRARRPPRRSSRPLRRDAKRRPAAAAAAAEPEAEVRVENGVNVIVQSVEGLDADALLDLSDRFKQRHAPAAVVLGSSENGTVHLVANFDADVAERVSASDVVRQAAAIVGGGGGGSAHDGARGRERAGEAPRGARGGGAAHRRGVVRVLALDYGAARTGVAVSDATGTIARPARRRRARGDAGGPRADPRAGREQEAERVVVGLPLTLRGEHGEQARETEEFVRGAARGARGAGRDVRRALHDGARGAGSGAAARPRTRAPRRISSRATSRGRPRARGEAARSRDRRRARGRSRCSVGARAAAARTRRRRSSCAAARAAAGHLPRGVHGGGDGGSRRRGARDRDREAWRDAAAHAGGLRERERGRDAAEGVPEGLGREVARGLPLPGDVRVHEAHVVAAARARPAARVRAAVEQGRPALRALEEPDAVRRADHRVDGREGGGRAEGAAARRGGDLQPAAARDGARDRRDDPVRAERAGDGVAEAVGHRERQPVQHAPAGAGSRRRRSRTRGSRRSAPPRARRRSTTSTSCASRTACITSSRRASPSSSARRCEYGFSC